MYREWKYQRIIVHKIRRWWEREREREIIPPFQKSARQDNKSKTTHNNNTQQLSEPVHTHTHTHAHTHTHTHTHTYKHTHTHTHTQTFLGNCGGGNGVYGFLCFLIFLGFLLCTFRFRNCGRKRVQSWWARAGSLARFLCVWCVCVCVCACVMCVCVWVGVGGCVRERVCVCERERLFVQRSV